MLEAILLPTKSATRLWFAGSRLMLSEHPLESESGHHLYFTKHQENLSASDWAIVDGKSVYQIGTLSTDFYLKGKRIETIVATTDGDLIDRGVAAISESELYKWVIGKNLVHRPDNVPIPDKKVEPDLALPSFFAVMVEGKQSPVKTHKTYDEALEEAVRLCEKEHRSTFVLSAISLVSPSKPTVHYLGGN